MKKTAAITKPEPLPARRGGRPSKKTPAVVETLLQAAETGAPIKACCAVAGISVDTFNTWRDADADLQTRLDEARERGRVHALRRLQAAAADDWRAAESFLRLAFRQDYATRAEVAIEGAAAGFVIGGAQLAALQAGYREQLAAARE